MTCQVLYNIQIIDLISIYTNKPGLLVFNKIYTKVAIERSAQTAQSAPK